MASRLYEPDLPAGGYLIHRWFFVGRLLEKRVCHPLVRSDPFFDPPGDPKSTENALHVSPLVQTIFGVPESILGSRGRFLGSAGSIFGVRRGTEKGGVSPFS